MYTQEDLQFINSIFENPFFLGLFFLLTIWSLAWKGVALWKSAKNGNRNWFIAILLINSVGILEIVYLFYFSGKKKNASIDKAP